MNNHEIMEIISETVSSVLEKTAYMFPESVDITSELTFDEFEYVLVSLNFTGHKSGEIKMVFPVEFCAELSANLLGEDIENVDPGENDFDSAKELLNIVSGQLLVNLFGDQSIFSLINLEVRKIEREAFYNVIAGCEFFCCMIDRFPVITVFTLQEKVDEYKSINS